MDQRILSRGFLTMSILQTCGVVSEDDREKIEAANQRYKENPSDENFKMLDNLMTKIARKAYKKNLKG